MELVIALICFIIAGAGIVLTGVIPELIGVFAGVMFALVDSIPMYLMFTEGNITYTTTCGVAKITNIPFVVLMIVLITITVLLTMNKPYGNKKQK